MSFVHLHVHTEYTMGESIVRIKSLIDRVKMLGMPAIALTDEHNLFGAVKYFNAAVKVGIKPIIGADVWVSPDNDDPPYRLTLLCQNMTGYRQLTCLLSRAYLDGQVNGKPFVKQQWVQEHSEGLLLLLGPKSDVGGLLQRDLIELAVTALDLWQCHFKDACYLQCQRTNNEDLRYTASVVAFAKKTGVPLVATNDVRYLMPNEFLALEARCCIHHGETLADEKRSRLFHPQQYLTSPSEMGELFSDLPQALANTLIIAKRCNVQLVLGKNVLPEFPIPKDATIDIYLTEQATRGLLERLEKLFNHNERCQQLPLYEKRLKHELQVINNMGYAGYFLIVADFILWAKNNDVPVGPGRGSGAGSLVAFALGITDLDPIKYTLLFERFLNPERVSMPDFDIDFCMEGRDRVIDYVADRYGRESVSQIITFGTMAAKAVVRDVGRVLGHPYGFVDKIAKLIPFEIGMTLVKALASEDELRRLYEEEEDVKALIDLALDLEGITRNAGKHAGGVVISPSKLTDFTPLYCEAGGANLVTQFDKDDVEAVGLVKFDFLGLRTLTIIHWALMTTNDRQRKMQLPVIDINEIPMDDPLTFELLKRCETTAVFQLESRGMKDIIKRLQPDCFEEIIALVALFRPGPLQSGMVDDFINRKQGRATIEYLHPTLEPILKTTYGVILYQEQVMQIAQQMAGYTLGAADLLRRAMGKKKPEEMAKQRDIFTEGAVANGVDKRIATTIFDLMEKFAGYGFNKSHSAAYALLAYQTAWLKAHFPAAFMAAVLSSDMDNTDKVVNFIEDCLHTNINVIPPNINSSLYAFTVIDETTILYGLGAIKGVGEAAIESIIDSREKVGSFRDIYHFCELVDTRKANRRVIEALIRSGAMDDLGPHRAAMQAVLDDAMRYADQQRGNTDSGQIDLFHMDVDTSKTHVQFPEVPHLPKALRLAGEKQTLGLYLTGHPIDCYLNELSQLTIGRLNTLGKRVGRKVTVGGYVLSVRKLLTKKGKRMAIVTIDDNTARMDVAIFSEVYDLAMPILQNDALVLISGEVSVDDFSGGVRMTVERVTLLSEARLSQSKRLVLTLSHQRCDPMLVTRLIDAFGQFSPGSCPVVIDYHSDEGIGQIHLDPKWNVTPTDVCLETFEHITGSPIIVEYA